MFCMIEMIYLGVFWISNKYSFLIYVGLLFGIFIYFGYYDDWGICKIMIVFYKDYFFS